MKKDNRKAMSNKINILFIASFLFVFSLFLLFSISFAFAADINAPPSSVTSPLPVDTSATAVNSQTNANTATNAGSPAESLQKIQDATNNFASTPIVLPGEVDKAARAMLGLNYSDPLVLQKLVILICLFFMFLVIIHTAVKDVPFIGEGQVKPVMVSIIIALLGGFSGGLQSVYKVFFWVVDSIAFLQKWKILGFILGLVIFSIFFIGFIIVIKILKIKVGIMESKELGFVTRFINRLIPN